MVPEHLDQVARRPDVAAVLLYLLDVHDSVALAEMCSRVAPHVPIVHVSATPPRNDPWLEPWIQSLGVLPQQSLARAAEGLALAWSLEPPTGTSCLVVGRDPAAVEASSSMCARAGFNVRTNCAAPSQPSTTEGQYDLLVALVGEDEDVEATHASLAALRAGRPTIPVIAVLDAGAEVAAGPALPGIASETVAHWLAIGVTAVAGDIDLGIGLRLLADWSATSSATGAMQGPQIADVSRLRRVVFEHRRGVEPVFAESTQNAFAAALGIPLTPTRWAPYLEDAAIAASTLGYPVRVAAVHDRLPAGVAPRWSVAYSGDVLRKSAEEMLISAQRASGGTAQLMVARTVPSARVVDVLVTRHAAYGGVAEIRCEEAVGYAVSGMDQRAMMNLVGGALREPQLVAAAVSIASSAFAALEAVAELEALELSVEVASSGPALRFVLPRVRPLQSTEQRESAR
jgi:hypothetical protein